MGGFFALELPPSRRQSLLTHWAPPDATALVTRHNARSALRARLEALGSCRLWLPAYSCRSLAEAAPASCTVLFYPQDDRLQVIPAEMERRVLAGDVFLIIDYFGQTPDLAVRAWVARRPDVHWIEDRAHVLDGGQSAWGDDVLYSPRKVCGVPDGGLLYLRRRSEALPSAVTGAPPEHYADAALARLQERTSPGLAYRCYVRQEQAMTADNRAMSELALGLLAALPWRPLVASRQRNYRYLQARLAHHSFLGPLGACVPSHFVLRVRQADKVSAGLRAVGIFAQRHWAELAAPEQFTAAHSLSRELLSLPCDHRYGAEHMLRMVQALEPLL